MTNGSACHHSEVEVGVVVGVDVSLRSSHLLLPFLPAGGST